MLLTIDIGNTNMIFAAFDKRECIFKSRADTNITRMMDQYSIMIINILNLYDIDLSKIDASIISSVVPPVTSPISSALEKLTGIKPIVIGPGIKTGLNIKIDNPVELGADLVCLSVAAKTLYKNPCIAVDLGTVTKIMAIDKTGALIGGAFSPGINTNFKAMLKTTATLPLVGVGEVKNVIGTNSTDCIRIGVLYGAACMIDGLIEQFEKEIGEECSVVVAGGFSSIIAPHLKRNVVINEGLVSKGLEIIYNKNKV